MSTIEDGLVLAHFIVSDDVERSGRFYTDVLGGRTVIGGEAGDHPTSMLNFTRTLLKLRAEHPALANDADFQPLSAKKNSYPFVYLRSAQSQKIIVAVNPAADSCSVKLEGFEEASPLLVQGVTLQSGLLELKPVSFGIFAVHPSSVPVSPPASQ